MTVTVVGSGPAAPQTDTSGSGLLVSRGDDHVLVDCGPGVVSRLRRRLDPRRLRAVVVTHFHGDHYLDLVPLRYLLPWPGSPTERLTVILPPGGRQRLEALAQAVSERPGFFESAYDIVELDPAGPLCAGSLRLTFSPSQHYVPAWSTEIVDPWGTRIAYSGDTGPGERLEAFARGADLFVTEATLQRPDEDDERRGHLTADEAFETAERAGVRRLLLVHYPTPRRAALEARGALASMPVSVGRPGMRLRVEPANR